jgi:hypothetical protein
MLIPIFISVACLPQTRPIQWYFSFCILHTKIYSEWVCTTHRSKPIAACRSIEGPAKCPGMVVCRPPMFYALMAGFDKIHRLQGHFCWCLTVRYCRRSNLSCCSHIGRCSFSLATPPSRPGRLSLGGSELAG